MGMCIIPQILTSECSLVLEAYYGGPIRAGWHMIKWGIIHSITRGYWNLLLAMCDKIGWTRLQQIPGTEHFERHGGKCKYHNCQDMECITNSLPRWFKFVTRWHK